MSNVSTSPAPRRYYSSRQLLGLLTVLIGGIGILKFVGLLLDLGPAQAPWGFLLVIVLPFVVGRVLLPVRPRVGAVVIGTLAAAVAVLSIAVVGWGHLEPYWADYVLVYLGGPLALAAVVVSIRVLRGR